MSNYQPRLSINISTEQRKALDHYFPWGTQKKVFGVIIDDLIRLCEVYGPDKILGAFLTRHLTLEEISFRKKKDGND